VIQIKTLKFILDPNEKILWQGRVNYKALKKITMKLNTFFYLFITLSFLSILYLILCFFPYFNIDEMQQSMIQIVTLILFGISFPSSFLSFLRWREYLHNYNYLIEVRYYLTKSREFEQILNYRLRNYDRYCSLKLKEVNKVVIRPIIIKGSKLAYIDFYSDNILKNFNEFCYQVESFEHLNEDHQKNTESVKLKKIPDQYPIILPGNSIVHRFYFIDDYKKLEKILNQIIPNRVVKNPCGKKDIKRDLLITKFLD